MKFPDCSELNVGADRASYPLVLVSMPNSVAFDFNMQSIVYKTFSIV